MDEENPNFVPGPMLEHMQKMVSLKQQLVEVEKSAMAAFALASGFVIGTVFMLISIKWGHSVWFSVLGWLVFFVSMAVSWVGHVRTAWKIEDEISNLKKP